MQQIYLDHNATTIVYPEVIELMQRVSSFPYNASAAHFYGRTARKILEEARDEIFKALHIVKDEKEYQILFTSSGSEANNLAINSFAPYQILVTASEHASVLRAAKKLPGCEIIKLKQDGLIDFEYLEELLSKNTGKKLISVMYANNETGVIQDMKAVSNLARQYNAYVHCDAVQAFGKINLDLKNLDIDLLTISAHKCGGPIGAACLVMRKNIKLSSQIVGGDQEYGLRAGTENVAAVAGFGLAAKMLPTRLEIMPKIRLLRDGLEKQISDYVKDICIIGQNISRLDNTSCIIMPNVSNETQLINFDLAGISISSGSACSVGKVSKSYVLEAMGISEEDSSSAIRVSLGINNNQQEIKYFVEKWQELYNRTRKT